MASETAEPSPTREADVPTFAEESARADRVVERAFIEREPADRAVIAAFLRDVLDA
ncbi:hypothetical protein [Glaciibacter flavus]|uniref:hypothetical protein n=1 Tax=Orlajensenia flava TaxID=2565934 RepID=UPI003B0079C1